MILRNPRTLSVTLALAFAAAPHAIPTGFKSKDLITGLDAVSSAVLPDGRILAVEKHGKVHLIKNGVRQTALFMNWESNTNSAFEKGMMAIEPDPEFSENGYIYVWYTDKRVGGNGQNRVSRFKVNGDAVDASSEKLMISLGDAGANYHHGGGIAIVDGKMFIASGCRGGINDAPPGPSNAADKNRVEGKILRLNLDGSIPTDNPYYATNTGDARAVYYVGLRQPFTMSYNPKLKKLWFSEVQGGSGNDKVVEGGAPGTDYGFQNRGGAASLWTASRVGANTRSMIGSLWYTGKNFPAEWQDLYFFGGIAGDGSGSETSVNMLAYNYDRTGSPKNFGSFRCPIDMKQDANGAMYVTVRCQTENARYQTGKVIRVWYGETEPPYGTPVSLRPALEPARRMAWTTAPGRVKVELKQDGPQSVELTDLSGRLLARATAAGKGSLELAAPAAAGAHLLVWKSGNAKAVAKVVL